jgi:hypothetical protein
MPVHRTSRVESLVTAGDVKFGAWENSDARIALMRAN